MTAAKSSVLINVKVLSPFLLGARRTIAGLRFSLAAVTIAASAVTCLSLAQAQDVAEQKSRQVEPPAAAPPAGLPQISFGRSNLRETMKIRAKQLEEGKFAEFAKAFDPALVEVLPAEKFERLMGELAEKYGALDRVRDRWTSRRYGLQDFHVLNLKWANADLELRLAIAGDHHSIAALWIGARKGSESPPDFNADAFRFGGAASEAARANLSLSARVVDADGELVPAHAQFYREIEDQNRGPHDWRDEATNTTWQRISGEAVTCQHLIPGNYRILVHEWHGHNRSTNPTRYGLSNSVSIDGSQIDTEAEVKLENGSTLLVRAIDLETKQSLGDVAVELKRTDATLPGEWQRYATSKVEADGLYVFEALPPGKYRVTASKRAYLPQDVERTSVPPQVDVEIARGANRELTIELRTTRLDAAQIAKHWPWIATGRVTDPSGAPIAGATVRASTGLYTLLGRSTTTTDADGRYRLHFAEGIGMADPVALQAALIAASKPGYYETNLNQQGWLAMARQQPGPEALESFASPRLVFLPNEPREVNFTLARAATIDVELVDSAGESIRKAEINLVGKKMQPGGSVMDSGDTNHGGDYTIEEVPLRTEWWIAAAASKELSARTLPFQLDRPGTYAVTLMLKHDTPTDGNLLEVQSFRFGRDDVRQQVLRDDPLMRPAVSEVDRVKAMEILKKVETANQAWWAKPAATVESIRYDFVPQRGERQTYAYEHEGHEYVASVAHGLTFNSATAAVCAGREKLLIRMVEVEPERIRIAYTTREHLKYAVGNGVRGKWNGYMNGPVGEGILTIDPTRWVPVEHSFGRDHRELFLDYAQLSDDRWAPRNVLWEANGRPRFDWRFNVYEPGVWLFSSSIDTQDPAAAPLATLENVVINGQFGKRIE